MSSYEVGYLNLLKDKSFFKSEPEHLAKSHSLLNLIILLLEMDYNNLVFLIHWHIAKLHLASNERVQTRVCPKLIKANLLHPRVISTYSTE